MDGNSRISRLLSKLSVSRKLMLIYALDLSAVVFVTAVLVQEQFIAINFARQEMAGTRYIDAIRDDLIQAGRGASTSTDAAAARDRLAAAEQGHGKDMKSEQAMGQLAAAYEALAAAAPAQRNAAATEVLTRGRALITRVGNQSNLILDPNLDSYYTMSLVVLRFPELLDMAQLVMARQAQMAAQGLSAQQVSSQYLLLAGRLDALREGIASDYGEAMAAGGPALRERLQPQQQRLLAALDQFRAEVSSLAMAVAQEGDPLRALVLGSLQTRLLDELQPTWLGAGQSLKQLLQTRVDGFYQRLAKSLAGALAMLAAILGLVYVVARHITYPLRQLTRVTDAVRRSGDHSRRAEWRSEDEIGQLVLGFNDMLAQLDHEREAQKARAANEREALVQRSLIESLPVPMVVTAMDNHALLHANSRGQTWLGGRLVDIWQQCLDQEAREQLLGALKDPGASIEFDVRWLGGPTPIWTVLSAQRMQYQGQDAVLTASAPVNRMQVMERSLDLWGRVFESSSEGIVILDGQRRIITANPAFSRQSGHALADVMGLDPGLVLGLQATARADGALWLEAAHNGNWQGEVQVTRRDGSSFPAWLMVGAVWPADTATAAGPRDPEEVLHYIATFIDISERKLNEERIRFLAEHDALTGLPNRVVCSERLGMALQMAQRSGHKVAVLFVDLDHFKNVNDSLGHHVGDGLLRQVAAVLSDAVRGGDTVSRLGGDEFVVVLGGLQGIDELNHIVDQRLVPRLRDVQPVKGSELRVSCSMGIAVYPDDALDADTLLRHADTAMYQAKADGRNSVRFFDADMTLRAQERRVMERDLRLALEQDQLCLHWQPRVCASSERLLGVEGLLRWQHPVRGMVMPDRFIALAEETGLIVPIGAWVIEQACRQVAAWRDAGVRPFGVSVNLSARQLRDDKLIAVVQSSLQRHGIEPGVLELELTESMVMDGAERNLRQLHALRALGASLSIDDFGTGYSSLAYLSRFPIDKLKVDRSFVMNMLADPTRLAIARAIIGLGHTLGLKVVAEGVEEPRMAQLLREAGCNELQGYLFARPMPAADLLAWMAEREEPQHGSLGDASVRAELVEAR